jgi:hypothetical protein
MAKFPQEEDASTTATAEQRQNQQQSQGQAQRQAALSNSSSQLSSGDQWATSGPSSAANGDQITTNLQTYEEVYRAPYVDSGVLLMNNAPCKTFLGIQFSGANSNGAGATGLGIPIDDEDCKLDKAARLAFSAGNLQYGWFLFCSQPVVSKAGMRQQKLLNVTSRAQRRRNANARCMAGAIDKAATLTNIKAELTELTATLIQVQALPGYDDAALRARIQFLESAAHRPDSRALIVEKHEYE